MRVRDGPDWNSVYSRQTFSTKIYAQWKLFFLKAGKADDILEHLAKFEKQVNEVKSSGETVANKDGYKKMLTFFGCAPTEESQTVEHLKSLSFCVIL